MADPDRLEERIRRSNDYYDRFAENVAERTGSRDFTRALRSFVPRLTIEGVVLDIGCGTGGHLAMFRDMGYEVLGIEPSSRMREIAAAEGLPVVEGAFETLNELSLPAVAGVWCASSLLHVPAELFPSVVASIRHFLPAGAPFYMTVRLGEGSRWDKWDDQTGDAERFMQYYSEPFLVQTLEASGLTVIDKWTEESTWGMPSTWISIVTESAGPGTTY